MVEPQMVRVLGRSAFHDTALTSSGDLCYLGGEVGVLLFRISFHSEARNVGFFFSSLSDGQFFFHCYAIITLEYFYFEQWLNSQLHPRSENHFSTFSTFCSN